MCTQVGVGALIVGYAAIGAAIFTKIEGERNNTEIETMNETRQALVGEMWEFIEDYNTLNTTAFFVRINELLVIHQSNFTESVRRGYEQHKPEKIWNYSASLMFCLSVFSMIGYGNLVPKTKWGKVLTMVYASFGIPLYVLYFVSMGKVLASSFKWVYTWMHECSSESGNANGSEEGSSLQLPKTKKKIIVPSTACLWVISFYITGGTIMFAGIYSSREFSSCVLF
jgi:potassium channel subfamily K protein